MEFLSFYNWGLPKKISRAPGSLHGCLKGSFYCAGWCSAWTVQAQEPFRFFQGVYGIIQGNAIGLRNIPLILTFLHTKHSYLLLT
jgi:hypothetical protein